MEHPKHKLNTITDILNVVNVDNWERLSHDISSLLQSFAKLKASEKDLLIDKEYQLTWTDDGEYKCYVNIDIIHM